MVSEFCMYMQNYPFTMMDDVDDFSSLTSNNVFSMSKDKKLKTSLYEPFLLGRTANIPTSEFSNSKQASIWQANFRRQTGRDHLKSVVVGREGTKVRDVFRNYFVNVASSGESTSTRKAKRIP